MQEPVAKAVSITGGPALEQPNAERTLEERVAALEVEVARLKAELRTDTLQATSYRPDASITPGNI